MPEAYDLIEQGKIKTLADLNRFFAAWLDVAYQQRVHNTFKQRPADRYAKSDHPIRRIPPHELAEVFLPEENRRVDKTCCVSLLGSIYEVESHLAGRANNGVEAVAAVTDGPIKQVYLKRLVRQDGTGVWSVVGYDPR